MTGPCDLLMVVTVVKSGLPTCALPSRRRVKIRGWKRDKKEDAREEEVVVRNARVRAYLHWCFVNNMKVC